MLSRYPVLRSMAAYSVLYPGANVFQQVVVRKEEAVDWREAARFLVYGGVCHAPIVHGWLKLANAIFPGTSTKQVFKKVLMDQTCFAPFALTSFYAGLSALEFNSLDVIYEEWRAKFPGTWAMGACIWPFLQGFNFRFVPAPHRPIFVGVMSFFWTTALAYWKHQKVEPPKLVKTN